MSEASIIPLRGPRAQRPLAERDDDELMLLVRAGAADAMAVVVGRYHAKLTSFCAKQTGDSIAAEELVQEAFLRLWRNRASYRAEGKLCTLLYTAVRNLCANHSRWWRRRSRWIRPDGPRAAGEQEPAAEPSAALPSAIDAMIERERLRDVDAAVLELGTKQRQAVLLRFEHGLPYDQIATILGTNESTARSRVHLGLAALRARLALGAVR